MSKYQIRDRRERIDVDGKVHVEYSDPEPILEPTKEFTVLLEYLLSDKGRAEPIEVQQNIISKMAFLIR